MDPSHAAGIDEQQALPFISYWITSARTSRYNASILRDFGGLSEEQFDLFSDAALYRPAQEWLNEIRIWDATCLIGSGFSQGQIANAAFIQDYAEFSTAFSQYHGCYPAEFITIFHRRTAGQKEQLAAIFGEPIPEQLMPLPPWMIALYALSPRVLTTSSAYTNCCNPGPAAFAHFLHSRVCQGQTAAKEAFATLLTGALAQRLRITWPHSDEQVVAEAAENVIIRYLGHPETFDANRQPTVLSFLRKAADQDLKNLRRSDERRRKKENLWANDVTPLLENRHIVASDDLMVEIEIQDELNQKLGKRQHWLREFVASLPVHERQIFELIVHKERRLEPLAKILGITAWPESEQKKHVARLKHRLHERLKYWMQKHGPPK